MANKISQNVESKPGRVRPLWISLAPRQRSSANPHTRKLEAQQRKTAKFKPQRLRMQRAGGGGTAADTAQLPISDTTGSRLHSSVNVGGILATRRQKTHFRLKDTVPAVSGQSPSAEGDEAQPLSPLSHCWSSAPTT